MSCHVNPRWVVFLAMVLPSVIGCSERPGGGARAVAEPLKATRAEGRKLTHEETLQWIDENRAWKLAHKTRPIWVRDVAPGEVGKEFLTADHAKEIAREGVWLCAGVAGEPWFQTREKVEAKYELDGAEEKRFDFDAKPNTYRRYKPKGTVRNWVAKVEGPGIEGFSVRPGYDPERPLYSPGGGYAVIDDVKDPYTEKPKDVWLVQQALFESTYEIIPPSPR
jgi:hypothetical protein